MNFIRAARSMLFMISRKVAAHYIAILRCPRRLRVRIIGNYLFLSSQVETRDGEIRDEISMFK